METSSILFSPGAVSPTLAGTVEILGVDLKEDFSNLKASLTSAG